MFRTMYNNTIGVLVTPSGDKFRKLYRDVEPYETDIHGECINKSRFVRQMETGEVVDIQAEINSYLESTRLETILRSMNRQLQKVVFDDTLEVADLTDLPATIHELRNAQSLYNDKIAPALKEFEQKQVVQANNSVSLTPEEILGLRDVLRERVGK